MERSPSLRSASLPRALIATCGLALIFAILIPATSYADPGLDTGEFNKLSKAKEQMKIIEDNDIVKGPEISADTTECTSDPVSEGDKEKIFNALNALRALHHSGPVDQSSETSMWEDTQKASISMTKQNGISHTLEITNDNDEVIGEYPCRPAEAVNAAGASVLSYTGGTNTPSHMRNLVADVGVKSLGHRMQLLAPSLGTSAFGVTHRNGAEYNPVSTLAMITLDTGPYSGQVDTTSPSTNTINAWPAKGFFPYELLPRDERPKKKETDERNQVWSFYPTNGTVTKDATVTITNPDTDETIAPRVSAVQQESIVGSPEDTLRIEFPRDAIAKPAKDTYSQWNVKVTEGGQTWEYPVYIYSDLTITNPFNSLPDEIVVPEGQAIKETFTFESNMPFTYTTTKTPSGSSTGSTIEPSATTAAKSQTASLQLAVDDYADGDQIVFRGNHFGDTTESKKVTIRVVKKPELTVTPNSQTYFDDESAGEFTATTDADSSVTWQKKEGTTWTDIGTGLKFTPTDSAAGSYTYRAVAKNEHPDSTTVELQVTVRERLKITTQPTSVTTIAGQSVTFKTKASMASATYQWQQSADGDPANFTDISGATSASYSVDSPVKDSRVKYRVIVTDTTQGTTQELTSNTVGYTIVDKLSADKITPVSAEVNDGDAVTFSGQFNISDNMTYQWQYDGGNDTWNDIDGATNLDYSFDATEAKAGKYRVVGTFTSGGITQTETTSPATLTVHPLIAVTKPADVAKVEGDSATFSVTTNSSDLQWQSRPDSSGTWEDISGETSKTLELTTTTTRENGYQYRVVAKGPKDQEVYSDPATLTVYEKLEAATLSLDKTEYNDGDPAKLTITSTPQVDSSYPGSPTAHFEMSKDGGSSWETYEGYSNTPEPQLDITAEAAMDTWQFRATVTTKDGQKKTTDPVSLKVLYAPIIDSSHEAASGTGTEDDYYIINVQEGNGITLNPKLTANPNITSTQWQQYYEDEWVDVPPVRSFGLTIPADRVKDGKKFRLHASNSKGKATSYYKLHVTKKKPGAPAPGKPGNKPGNTSGKKVHKFGVATTSGGLPRLARTGTESQWLLYIGIMMLAAGLPMIESARRRKQ